MSLRLVMMGTGRFALPAFSALFDSPHEVCGLFTQPDRAGRGHHRHPHPMKDAAHDFGTPVFQPEDINTPAAAAELRSLQPDLGIVVAYGQILSAEILAIPRFGCINLHASLLPKYRGAAPVQYAVLQGESETGVTIFQIEPRLDAGPILGMAATKIGPHETSGELEQRLAELAVPLTLKVVDQIEAGRTEVVQQDPQQVTRAPRLKKSDGLINWSLTPQQLDCHVRAMQPWPNAYTFLESPDGQLLRMLVFEVRPSERSQPEAATGEVIFADQREIHIQTGGGGIEILRLRPEGKREMTTQEFLCGHAVAPGWRFLSHEPGQPAAHR